MARLQSVPAPSQFAFSGRFPMAKGPLRTMRLGGYLPWSAHTTYDSVAIDTDTHDTITAYMRMPRSGNLSTICVALAAISTPVGNTLSLRRTGADGLGTGSNLITAAMGAISGTAPLYWRQSVGVSPIPVAEGELLEVVLSRAAGSGSFSPFVSHRWPEGFERGLDFGIVNLNSANNPQYEIDPWVTFAFILDGDIVIGQSCILHSSIHEMVSTSDWPGYEITPDEDIAVFGAMVGPRINGTPLSTDACKLRIYEGATGTVLLGTSGRHAHVLDPGGGGLWGSSRGLLRLPEPVILRAGLPYRLILAAGDTVPVSAGNNYRYRVGGDAAERRTSPTPATAVGGNRFQERPCLMTNASLYATTTYGGASLKLALVYAPVPDIMT